MSRAESALGLARAGWNVFPLHHHVGEGRCSCGDKLCYWPHNKTAAKHPRTAHGKDDATSDPTQVMAWWGKWPEANIGLRTGDGVFVVDVDGEAGWEFLKNRELPETLSVRTGRGVHLYFYAPEGVCIRNRAKVGPELDVRGDGGYVLAPPSGHASGETYEWVDEAVPIADAPAWLVELVRERPAPVVDRAALPVRTDGLEAYARAALEGEVARVMDAMPGTRNDTLNTAAFALGQLVGAGALPESATEALRDAGLAVGLSERETDLTLRSGLEAGKREPRDIPEPRARREASRRASPSPSLAAVDIEPTPGIVAGEYVPEQASSNGSRPHVEYPLGVWPGPVAEFIEQTARSVCVAPEAVGTCVLAVVAGAVGRSRWLAVKDDWLERPGIYAGLVAASGERKSPALRAVKAPLEALHSEAAARWLKEHEEWESTPGTKGEPELSAPMLKDVTTEVLALALRTHPRGVILVRPELVGWVKSHGQYKAGRGDDRQKWLEAHDQEQLDVRRVGRKPILVPHPVVSVLGGVQPAVFDAITSVDDGLAERFLYDVMPSQDLLASTPAVSRAARETWEAIVRELYGFVEAEVVCEAEGCLVGARQRALDLRRDAPARMRSYYGKGEMHLARIAIALAAVWEVSAGAGRELTAAGVQRAEDLWGFHAAQAERLFTGDVVPLKAYEAASPGQESAVVSFLWEQGGRCTKRELMNRGPLRQMRSKDADETLGALIARGQIGLESGPRKDSLIVVLL